MRDLLTAKSEEDALEDLHRKGLTDGLPVVVPTPSRVDRMALASGNDPDMVIGAMGPGNGVATIEKIAVAAVMAGCVPDHMPVVLAAVKAVINPVFDLTEMQATTHCTAPLIIVNGPARFSCGPISSGYGALGPGHRANASIGRALRLAMINIGGGRPGSSDMALLGHPGKFTYCLAENEEESPFEPLHTSFGFERDESIVTVMGAEAPHSVLFGADGDDPKSYKGLLDILAIGLANPATNNAILTGGSALIILNPEHAAVLADAGLNRTTISEELHTRCLHTEKDIKRLVPAFSSNREGNRNAFTGPEQILIMMAGGSGLYSMAIPTWSAGAHKNSPSCEKIETDFFCEIPEKKID